MVCYGVDIERDDHYDAIASTDLTSKFFYGFADSVLREVELHVLIDSGCGTGNFLAFLEKNGSWGYKRLVGIDLSGKTINERKERGLESKITKLIAADILDLKQGGCSISSCA